MTITKPTRSQFLACRLEIVWNCDSLYKTVIKFYPYNNTPRKALFTSLNDEMAFKEFVKYVPART